MSRVVLVAGASRGIGLALARALRAEGAELFLCARPSERLDALKTEFPGCVQGLDLRDEAAIGRWAGAHPVVDAYVHCAGDFFGGGSERLGAEQLRELFESNLLSAELGFAAVRERLRPRAGAALFFGTAGLESHRARRSSAAYSALKSALRVMVRSWALEESRHGVRVNLLSPGIVPHPDAEPSSLEPERQKALPLGRAARMEEVVGAARWLISERARYITGVNLEVAGGWLS